LLPCRGTAFCFDNIDNRAKGRDVEKALAGKRALVTGASGGIGLATSRALLEAGARVVGLDQRWGDQPKWLVCCEGDVTNSDDLDAAVEKAAEGVGLDICVANAGILVLDDWLTGDPRAWASVLDVNLLGVMQTFQAAARRMVADGRGGRLLATASTAGIRADIYSAAYCASKAGVISIVQSAALAFAEHGITANAVAPGEVDTEMHAHAMEVLGASDGRSAEEVRDEAVAALPLRRMGQPTDVAKLFTFLASDAAAYITGLTIPIDGGLLLT
jgi:NAD(P)-dependent dehydrogenase (short-subunit alcohol dehydrogenase family)